MSISEAQKRVVAKYNAKSYDEVKVRLSKGKKTVIQAIADEQGKGVSTVTSKKP